MMCRSSRRGGRSQFGQIVGQARGSLLTALVSMGCVASAASGETGSWSEDLEYNGIHGIIEAAVVFDDDGPGPNQPALYVGGALTTAAGKQVWGVAKWDGQEWSALAPLFHNNTATIGRVQSMALFDDNNDGIPSLFIGGIFNKTTTSPPAVVNAGFRGIAKWSGTVWQTVGGGFSPQFIVNNFDPEANAPTGMALYVHDDDGEGPIAPALYAGGNFVGTSSGIKSGLARWDGSAWTTIGAAPGPIDLQQEIIHDFQTFDTDGSGPNPPELYICGTFADSRGVSILRWNGTTIESVPGTLPCDAVTQAQGYQDMAVFDADGAGPNAPELYLSSRWECGTQLHKFNGSTWSDVGILGEGIRIYDMTVHNDGSGPALFIGVDYRGNPPLGYGTQHVVTKWDGTTMTPIGTGLVFNSPVRALVPFDDGGGERLFAVGGIRRSPGFMKWNGSAWLPGTTGEGTTNVYSATVGVDPDGTGPQPGRLYAAGGAIEFSRAIFGTAVPDDSDANDRFVWVGEYDGTEWRVLGNGFMIGESLNISSLAWVNVGSGGSLYAGGSFGAVGGDEPQTFVPLGNIARWNGTSWEAVGVGIGGRVNHMTGFDPDGNGPLPERLIVVGNFDTVYNDGNGTPAPGIAQWDGTSWSAVGSGITGFYGRVAAFDDGSGPGLYAAGTFTLDGGEPVAGIAKWDGTAWSSLGAIPGPMFGNPILSYFVGTVWSMASYTDSTGPGLIVAGQFTEVAGVPACGVAKWNGTSWSAMDAGLPCIVEGGQITSLAVWNDGSGTGLYASNLRGATNLMTPVTIGKWDGTQWTNFNTGAGFTVRPRENLCGIYTMTPVGSGAGSSLYATGWFDAVDGVRSTGIARWMTPPAPSCPADFNGDGARDVADLFAYINAWLAKTANADFNNSGNVDVADLFAYINAWLAGCP